MARSVKNTGMLVFVLLTALAVIAYSAYSSIEGFRTTDCLGITCAEGQFCQQNKCTANSPPITNNYNATQGTA